MLKRYKHAVDTNAKHIHHADAEVSGGGRARTTGLTTNLGWSLRSPPRGQQTPLEE